VSDVAEDTPTALDVLVELSVGVSRLEVVATVVEARLTAVIKANQNSYLFVCLFIYLFSE
jgi:hypothetical protein